MTTASSRRALMLHTATTFMTWATRACCSFLLTKFSDIFDTPFGLPSSIPYDHWIHPQLHMTLIMVCLYCIATHSYSWTNLSDSASTCSNKASFAWAHRRSRCLCSYSRRMTCGGSASAIMAPMPRWSMTCMTTKSGCTPMTSTRWPSGLTTVTSSSYLWCLAWRIRQRCLGHQLHGSVRHLLRCLGHQLRCSPAPRRWPNCFV